MWTIDEFKYMHFILFFSNFKGGFYNFMKLFSYFRLRSKNDFLN